MQCLAAAAFAAGLGALVSFSPTSAQTYPQKSIRLVLPYSPGGIVDFAGRILGQKLGEILGQTVVPDNRAGAGGIAGTDIVARARPDGYTLVIMDPAIVINPTLQPSMPYDLFKQLTPVSIVSSSPEVLVTSKGLKVESLPDLIDYARANPGRLNFASAGVGTTPHLAGEMLKQLARIDASHVPYRSIGEAFPDLISGKVQFAFSSIAGAKPFTSSGDVRAIATTGPTRSSVFPNLPTVAEAALPMFEVDLWLAVFAPADLPADILQKLNTALSQALQDKAVRDAFASVSIEPRGTSPEEATAVVKAEFAKWKSVIEAAKVTLN